MTTAVIGLGAMGQALAKTLLKAGYRITVWNRTPGKDAALAAAGAERANSAAAAMSAADVTIICLLTYDSVEEVLASAGDALGGKVLVNLTNGTPEQARDIAGRVAALGAEYLDGGIMAVPPMIGQTDALILYSGSAAAFNSNQEMLGTLGVARYLGEDPGLAPLYDLSLLTGMYGLFAGALHALALISTENVKATAFAPMLMQWLSAMLQALPRFAEEIDTGNYTEHVVSNLAMQTAAFGNFIEVSKAQGIRPDLLEPVQALMKQTVEAGYGAGNFSALIEVMRLPKAAAQ